MHVPCQIFIGLADRSLHLGKKRLILSRDLQLNLSMVPHAHRIVPRRLPEFAVQPTK